MGNYGLWLKGNFGSRVDVMCVQKPHLLEELWGVEWGVNRSDPRGRWWRAANGEPSDATRAALGLPLSLSSFELSAPVPLWGASLEQTFQGTSRPPRSPLARSPLASPRALPSLERVHSGDANVDPVGFAFDAAFAEVGFNYGGAAAGGTEGGGGLEQFVFDAAWADAVFAEIGLNPANPAQMRARRRAEARFERIWASGMWAYSSSTSGSEEGSEPAEG